MITGILRGIVKYAHCSVKKFIAVVIVFIMFSLFKEVFIKETHTVANHEIHAKDYYYYLHSSYDNGTLYPTVATSNKGSSYFISLSYFEQLTCGTRNLLSTGNVAQNLEAKVVLPFLLRSRLYGIPDLISSKEVPDIFLPLHTVYDIVRLNETFHSLSNTYLVDYEDFLYNAPREIVMVDLIHRHVAPKELSLNKRSIIEIGQRMEIFSYDIFNCSRLVFKREQPLLEKIKLMLRISTRRLGVKKFTIKKYICINPYANITTDELKRFLGPEPCTILFTQWRGCAYHSCDIRAPGNITSSFRYRFLYHSNQTKSVPRVNDISLPLSNVIKSTALRYLQRIKLYSPFISIHIRIEKLSRVNDKINGHTACCLGILNLLLKSLEWRYFNHRLLITDIGQYGSDACYDKVCLPHSRKVKGMLKTMGLIQQSFNPSVVNSSKNPAFASLVEMHMLAQGDRLVVMGHGSFKRQIISNFLNSNPTNKLYHICTEEGNKLNEFENLNRDCWIDNG